MYRYGVLETQKSNGLADLGDVKSELGMIQSILDFINIKYKATKVLFLLFKFLFLQIIHKYCHFKFLTINNCFILALCVLAVFILVYFALWKGVKSSGKVIEKQILIMKRFLHEIFFSVLILTFKIMLCFKSYQI